MDKLSYLDMFSLTGAHSMDWTSGVICPLHPGEPMDSDKSLVHIGGVVVIQDSNVTVVSNKGATEIEDKNAPGKRGSVVKIRFFCESYLHEFALCFEFIKGSTGSWVEVDKDSLSAPDHANHWPAELWRD